MKSEPLPGSPSRPLGGPCSLEIFSPPKTPGTDPGATEEGPTRGDRRYGRRRPVAGRVLREAEERGLFVVEGLEDPDELGDLEHVRDLVLDV